MVRVFVSAEDIAAGKRRNCWKCPAAIAIRREMPTAVTVEVHNGYAVLDSGQVPLPWEAIEFIERFDRGLPVEPFDFEF